MRNESNYLHNLGFTTDNGLVHNLDEALNNVERLYIVEAKKLEANAVFFRRKYAEVSGEQENEPIPYESIPTVCIFQKEVNFFNSKEHKELHAALWSAGKTEVYVIQSDNRIDIINARKPAKRVSNTDVTIDDKDLVLGRVKEALEAFNDRRFSAHLFGSGTFWEQSEFQEKIDGNSSPYAFLLDYLMQARKLLSPEEPSKTKKTSSKEQVELSFSPNISLGLEAKTIDKLLITCILIKFLEDIKDNKGNHTLKKIYKKHQIDYFAEALEQGKCVAILGALANEFNGKIFDTFTETEKGKIATVDLTPIAQFLRANIDLETKQLFLWEQYSFQHLPAEVISGIYENFIQAEASRKGASEKGVVYTPIHLVNMLVDEVMPLEQPELFKNKCFKVLDPACGSGVFLVAAYKRILQWWTINNYRKTGKVKYPNKKVAQEILEKNIFGVDVEPTAVLVTIFGLTTAFLDKLTPKEIWDNLKFSELKGTNIQELNFSDWAKVAKENEEKFDLVIGNPPFNPSSLGTITNDDLKELFQTTVPGNKLSLKFFEAALYFGKKVCMIIPSSILLYNKTGSAQKYRSKIFTDYSVKKIFDFTHLRETLFVKLGSFRIDKQKKTGRTPVVAIILDKQKSEHQPIEHVVIKRELFSEKKMQFEIDYYDYHEVRWDWATDEKLQFIWKVNLLGGGRLFHFIYRLSLLRTLKEYIKEKQKTNPKWLFRTGYKVGGKTKKKYANFISEGDKISNVYEDGSYEVSREGERTKLLESFPSEIMYKPPFIIIDQILGQCNIPISLIKSYSSKKYLYFNRDFVGISIPREDLKEGEIIYNNIKNKYADLYKFITLVNSGSCLILTETEINKRDLDILPFPHDTNYLNLSIGEKVIKNDVLKYYIHLGKAISPNSAGAILHQPVTPKDLKAFGETYCNALNDIYAEDGKSWQTGEILQTPMFVCYQFGFGENGGLTSSRKLGTDEAILNLLEKTEGNSGVIHKKIIRTYQHENGYDCVYFIKPQTKRYWLKSIALRDADDTFMDLKNAGY